MNGEFLRKKLKDTDIQLVDIAKELKISPQSLENKLKAKQVKLDFVVDLAKAINKSVYYFIKGSEIEPYFFKAENNSLEDIEVDHTVSEAVEIYKLRTDSNNGDLPIPLYDIEATAGLVTLFKDTKQQKPIDHISIPNLPKCDGAIYVTGDSMYPLLKSGDIVMYKEIGDIKNDIFWGEMYLLSVETSNEEYITVKYIQKSDKGDDFVKLVSQNKHHQDRNIRKDRIKALALIKASIRINSMN